MSTRVPALTSSRRRRVLVLAVEGILIVRTEDGETTSCAHDVDPFCLAEAVEDLLNLELGWLAWSLASAVQHVRRCTRASD